MIQPVPLKIGPIEVSPPVVLAPMAGITNAAFRRLCRSFGADGSLTPERRGAGLYVSEMITARGLVERNAKTLQMARFADDEPVRSIQLYGTDPATMGEAVRFLVDHEGVDHIDLNFGCPVAKVTRKGGGAALPVRRQLFTAIVRQAITAAGAVPVTVKMRLGVDDQLMTFRDAARSAADEGAAAVALHARTAAQHYSGKADWTAITELKSLLQPTGIPVLGNGDIWQPEDAMAMMDQTGCDGVVIGRGCLGRPWLFRDVAAAFANKDVPEPPPLGEVARVLARHAALLQNLLELRKHIGWYLLGYPVGSETRRQLMACESVSQLEDELSRLDPDLRPLPGSDDMPRGKTSGPRKVVLPDRWTEGSPLNPLIEDPVAAISGG